ncbi:hypothetical protein L1987_21208 [Smallanthus sonchifolius]|uniref:Uncharacterized protein n=1 Tax=Smallanthus sonchifolius TaxID=185202 RepID=A0ACB9ITY9_9ASTR|nr:hypothetical protein L1987_21208 [Smallanthus sonchifolius]
METATQGDDSNHGVVVVGCGGHGRNRRQQRWSGVCGTGSGAAVMAVVEVFYGSERRKNDGDGWYPDGDNPGKGAAMRTGKSVSRDGFVCKLTRNSSSLKFSFPWSFQAYFSSDLVILKWILKKLIRQKVHQDTDVEPHVLRATVNNTEIAISSETIRAVLALGGAADDPMSYSGTLIMGCFQRMGYRGRPNDTQAPGTDGLKNALQAAMVALTLNKRFNFALYIYRELVMQITTAEGQGFLMYPRFIQMILNHLIPDLPQHPIRLTLTPMSKRIFTDCTKVKQQNAALIPVQTPLFGHLINPDYVEPPNDNWFHPDELAQGQGQNVQQQQPVQVQPQQQPTQQPQQQQVPVQQPIPIQEQVPIQQAQVDIPVNEPVQEEVVQEHEQDLGMNMEDFNDVTVNSPIHEREGNVVEEHDSNHYEKLASVPLENVGKRIKSTARRPRRKSVWDPPSGSVLGKRTLVDESSDTDSDFNPDPKAQKLMSASIAAAHSSQGVEDATFVASLLVTPPRSKNTSPVISPVPPVITPSPSFPHSSAGPSKPSDSERIPFLESQVLTLQTQVDNLVSTDSQRQLVIQTQAKHIADMQLLVSKLVERLDAQGELRILQGESTSQTIEGNKDASGVNEEVLLLEFFADSEEEEAEKIESLDDIDELFNDIEDDMSDNDVEEGEIVEIEIEKNKDNVTYEGSDGLNVPYNFIQDDVIPEFSYEGVTDSMDSIEDIIVPEDTAESKMDTDDQNVQSNIDAEADTTHTVSPKVNEEPVMYRNTGMTREQWKEVVNSWMKVLPKSQAQPAQKEKYVNKERCVGRIIGWFYDNDTKLFAIKRSDSVQYLKRRIKYFNTLQRCEMNGLASKPLINRSKFDLADVIANLIKREGGSGKYERLNPQKGKRVKIIDQKTGKVTWKYKFKPVRDVHKIPLKKIPQDFLGNMKWWKDQRTLRKNEIMFTDEWREQGLQYKRVLEICRRYGVHAGSRLPDKWKSSS